MAAVSVKRSIACEWHNHSFLSNKHVSQTLLHVQPVPGSQIVEKTRSVCAFSIPRTRLSLSLEHSIAHVKSNIKEIWKTVWLTPSFQKLQLQPVSIFFKVCLSVSSFVFLRCFLYHLYVLRAVMWWFTQLGGGSHHLNFDKFRDTVRMEGLTKGFALPFPITILFWCYRNWENHFYPNVGWKAWTRQ